MIYEKYGYWWYDPIDGTGVRFGPYSNKEHAKMGKAELEDYAQNPLKYTHRSVKFALVKEVPKDEDLDFELVDSLNEVPLNELIEKAGGDLVEDAMICKIDMVFKWFHLRERVIRL